MKMETLQVNNLGPIHTAHVEFGDLTLFIGPQANGKSILLQLLKLIKDKKHVRKIFEQFGFAWSNDIDVDLDRFFGEGMSGIWGKKTKIFLNGKEFKQSDILFKQGESYKNANENLFYVPAQRVVCFQNGWPRFFTAFEGSVPYVLRHFSETLRQLLEGMSSAKDGALFPQVKLLKSTTRDSFNHSIFHNGRVVLEKTDKKQFKLETGEFSIPFMAWSAGQKEFMPLLLSFYWLCPPSKVARKDDIRYVIIEEPEMGLHPEGIKSVLFQIMDLMSRGYKVLMSTHSPVVTEFAWAIYNLQQTKSGYKSLAELFDLKNITPAVRIMLTNVLDKKINAYHFDRKDDKVFVKDISTLDPGSDDVAISQWGGLSSFSSKATDIILNAKVNEE